MNDIILELQNLTKEFPGVKALDSVNIKVRRGEIHALCGENGAGKSTLIKSVCGVYPSDTYDGKILFEGEECHFKGIRDAENKGIVCIHQELALVPEMSVVENIFLGNQSSKFGVINFAEMYAKGAELLKKVGLNNEKTGIYIRPDEKVKNLGTGHQQLVEIAKALAKKTKLLILDEPTASLTEHEVDILLDIICGLRDEGITCIYISHKLDEVKRIADSVTILRDGHSIETCYKETTTMDYIIRGMVGREMNQMYPRVEHTRGEKILEVKNYSVDVLGIPGKKLIKNVSFSAYAGEILGISGLMGSGRTELFTSIFGAFDAASEGEVYICGEKCNIKSPKDAIKYGYILSTEDRKTTGLFLGRSIKDNTTISSLDQVTAHGVIDESKEIFETNKYMQYMRTKAPSFATTVGELSGGNQQKVVLSKVLMANPKVLVLDEPTRGIDVGAKYEIYNVMNRLVSEGVCVIMISSEMEEILGMSDRVIAIAEGEIKLDKDISEVTADSILAVSAKKQVN